MNKHPSIEKVLGSLFPNGVPKRPADGDDELLALFTAYMTTLEAVVSRRQVVHGFFLTINIFLVTVLSGIVKYDSGIVKYDDPIPAAVLVLLGSTVGSLTVYHWLKVSDSYRSLSAAKFAVLHSLETLLQARLYSAEKYALKKEGYVHLTKVERLVPKIFLAFYLVAAIGAIVILSLEPSIIETPTAAILE